MAMTKQYYKNDNIIMRTIDELVPKNHLVRKMENCMNFTFIEDEVKDLYSDFGRPSISPIVLFKMLILNKTKDLLETNTFKSIMTIPHEKLSHLFLYCDSDNKYIRNAMTQRNKHKFLTVVYFSPKN